jgi:electron transfer flavoprotein beta subunit
LDIVVCMKQVPDTTARKTLSPDYTLDRAAVENVVNPFDEYAIEEALQIKEKMGGEVTILTMGPPSAEETVRKALAMGADKAVLVTDDALHGTDWYGTCSVLAAALGRLQFDLVLTGMESTDARMGLVPAGLAEMLDLPIVTLVSKLEVSDGALRANRQISGGYQEIETQLPAVVSVVKGANEPRYPSLKGIMAAKRKEIEQLALADLGIEAPQVGLHGARTAVTAADARADKSVGEIVRPETPEEAAVVIADFLQARKFI